MNRLKYVLFAFSFIFLIVFLYNVVMSENCYKKCDKDPDCWNENHCGIGI